MTRQQLSGLGSVDLLTSEELREALGHHFSMHTREWFRGVDYLGFAGVNNASTVTIPGPDSGYVWSLKLASIQTPPAATVTGIGSVTNPAANAQIAATAVLPAGLYSVTATVFLSGTVTAADGNNMYLQSTGGANFTQIVYPGVANSPVTITTTVALAAPGTISVNALANASGAAAVYNASVEATPQGRMSVYLGDLTTVAPIGTADLHSNGVANEATITWTSNVAVAKDQRNITISAGGLTVQRWLLLVKQVPAEMQGKL